MFGQVFDIFKILKLKCDFRQKAGLAWRMRIIAVSVVKLFSKSKYMLGVQEEAPAKKDSFHSS